MINKLCHTDRRRRDYWHMGWDQIVEYVVRERRVIQGAPVAFLVAVTTLAGVIATLEAAWFNHQIDQARADATAARGEASAARESRDLWRTKFEDKEALAAEAPKQKASTELVSTAATPVSPPAAAREVRAARRTIAGSKPVSATAGGRPRAGLLDVQIDLSNPAAGGDFSATNGGTAYGNCGIPEGSRVRVDGDRSAFSLNSFGNNCGPENQPGWVRRRLEPPSPPEPSSE